MQRRFSLVATLFFISGATGLLYEVAFSKLLGYVFGATAYAVSTVLAAFMAGLALGAYFGGKTAGRFSRPLAAYGVAEIVVGAICAVSPAALDRLTIAYISLAQSAPGSLAAITALRAGLTSLVVVVPTVAMGATLPLLARVVASDALGDKKLPALYAINTAGGALGSVASAYAILPLLGVRGTMQAAALANVGIGIVAIVASRSAASHEDAPRVAASSTTPKNEDGEALLTALAAASGLLVFATEVVQTHLLALLIGNSAYAFGLMLAVFLVCLSIGAARAPRLAANHGAGAIARGLVYSAIAVALTLPLWEQLPSVFLVAGKVVSGWTGREIVRALAALVILAPPTVWMGSTFPLLLRAVAGRAEVARAVGRLTVANTLGTIAGSILTGYFVLPRLGSQGTLIAIAAAFAAAGVLAARGAGLRGSALGRVAALGAFALVAALLLPRWDLARLTNGANVYFTTGPRPDSIAFVREDVHGGVTTVVDRGPIHTMYTNGKFQGDDGPEMAAQRRFAHFPSLFVKREERALVIGLGTGTTLGTITAYPWKHIDVAEISPSIVEAAQLHFRGPSRNGLDDPRVHLDLNDGRNVILVAREPYDLVTIELTSVWFAGASSLYSREFYELVRSRLAPGGVLQQWVQLHHIRRRELATIVRTLRLVYPHVALFLGGAQGILVASAEPLVASQSRLARLEKLAPMIDVSNGAPLASLLSELIASESDLDRFVAESRDDAKDTPVSTDDDLYLEYATPKGNVLDYNRSLTDCVGMLEKYRTPAAEVRARHLSL